MIDPKAVIGILPLSLYKDKFKAIKTPSEYKYGYQKGQRQMVS